MQRRPPRSTLVASSAASDVYKRQARGYSSRRREAENALLQCLQVDEQVGPFRAGELPLRHRRLQAAALGVEALRDGLAQRGIRVGCLLYTSPSPRDS